MAKFRDHNLSLCSLLANDFSRDLFTLGDQDLIIFLRRLNLNWVLFTKDWAHGVRNELQQDVDWESDQGDEEAVEPLGAGESIDVDRHETAEELDTENLENNNDCPDSKESWVGVDTLEDVEFIIDLS